MTTFHPECYPTEQHHHKKSSTMIDPSTTPLSEDRRCWRCILLNRKCDRMPICQNCLSLGNEGLQILSCERGEITKRFDEAFANIIEISDGVWLFCTGKFYWKSIVDYSSLGHKTAISHGIVDLPWHFRGGLSSYEMYRNFIDQFDHTSRWPTSLENLSEELIIGAAEHERYFLESRLESQDSRQDSSPATWGSKDSAILSALRGLIRARNVAHPASDFPIRDFVDDNFPHEVYTLSKARLIPPRSHTEEWKVMPNIQLERMPPEFEPPNKAELMEPGETFPGLLKDAIETARIGLLGGDPRMWPSVWYTLCILILIHAEVDRGACFTRVLHTPQDAIWHAIESLARLYLHCCGDFHVLNNDGIDKEWYKLLMGDNHETHFLEFHTRWIAQRLEEESTDNIRDFLINLDNFVMDWTRF